MFKKISFTIFASLFLAINLMSCTKVFAAANTFGLANVNTSSYSITNEEHTAYAALTTFSVMSASIRDDECDVDVNSKIKISFSNPVDTASLAGENFSLIKSEGGTDVAVYVKVDTQNPNIVYVSPVKPLDYNSDYCLSISGNVKMKGTTTSLGQATIINFSTKGDLINLLVDYPKIIVPLGNSVQDPALAIYKGDPDYGEYVADAASSSSNSAVAIAEQGVIKGIRKGTTTITYTYRGKTVKVNVKVVPSIVDFEVNTPIVSVEIDKIKDVKLIAKYPDGTYEDITSYASFESANKDIATVDCSGKITGVSKGKTTIKVSLMFYDPINVDVNVLAQINKLTVSSSSLTLPAREYKDVMVKAIFADDPNNPQEVQSICQTVVADPSIVSVYQGTILGIKEGRTTVTYICGSKSISVKVVVKPEMLLLVLEPDVISVETGKTVNIKAKAVYADGKTEDVTQYADWSSSETDNNYITLNKGVVKGIAVSDNPIKIEARFVFESAEINVFVVPPIKTFTSDLPGTITMTQGEMLDPNLKAAYEDDSIAPEKVWYKINYTWSNSNIVYVDGNAIWANGDVGTTKITYTYGSKSITINVIVKPELDHLGINAEKVVVEKNNNTKIKVTAYYKNGTFEDVTKLAAYTIDGSAGVTVNSGKITAGPNAADTSFYVNYGTSKPIKIDVAVIDSNIKTLIAAYDKPKVFYSGDSITPTITAVLGANASIDVTADCIWTSSNNKVASVNPSTGIITAGIQGTATITANYGCRKVAIIVNVSRVL